MANELKIISSYLYKRLTSDERILSLVGKHPQYDEAENVWQVYRGIAPSGAKAPYVVFRYRTGEYRRVTGGFKTLTKASYLIFIAVEGDDHTVGNEVADSFEDLLNPDQKDHLGHLLGASASAPYESEEVKDDGTRVILLGATFDVQCRPIL